MAGDDICFTVMVANQGNTMKTLREHVNAQVKEYSNSPGDTFWEEHKVVQISPHQSKGTLYPASRHAFPFPVIHYGQFHSKDLT